VLGLPLDSPLEELVFRPFWETIWGCWVGMGLLALDEREEPLAVAVGYLFSSIFECLETNPLG